MELWDYAWTWKFTSIAKLWMRTIQSQTWRPFSIISMVTLILEKLTYQTHNIKFSWTRTKKEKFTINTSQELFKMCRLPQGLKNSSSILQNCIESNLKGIRGVVIFQDDVLLYGTTKDQYEKQMLAVKSRLREKKFTINKKKSNSKPVSSASFLG